MFHPCSPCSIAGSVIILPRMLPMLHNKGHANVTSAFPPPAVWDVPIVLGMLEKYIAVAGVATVPSLQEYAVLPDKVALHGMYAAHQAQVRRLASWTGSSGMAFEKPVTVSNRRGRMHISLR